MNSKNQKSMMQKVSALIILVIAVVSLQIPLPAGQISEVYADDTVVYGDVDGNNVIDVTDALLILKSYVGLQKLTGTGLQAADVDDNNVVDVTDALYVLKKYVGLVAELPVKSGGSAAEVSTTYVLNTSTMKFHYATCSSVSQMSEENMQMFDGTREEAIALGYEPCKRCNP